MYGSFDENSLPVAAALTNRALIEHVPHDLPAAAQDYKARSALLARTRAAGQLLACEHSRRRPPVRNRVHCANAHAFVNLIQRQLAKGRYDWTQCLSFKSPLRRERTRP
jgi:hypothetical protein